MKRSISSESFSSAVSDPNFNAFNVLSKMKEIDRNIDINENDDYDHTDESINDMDEYESDSPIMFARKISSENRIRGGGGNIGIIDIPSNHTILKRKKKGNDEDRVKRCRERNRIHARNSRERKKNQMEVLQKRLQQLLDEKARLTVAPSDTSVASILMSLAGKIGVGSNNSSNCSSGSSTNSSSSSSSSSVNNNNIIDENSSDGIIDQDMTSDETANGSVKDYLSENNSSYQMQFCLDDGSEDIDDADRALLMKDRSLCTSQELEMIRRERNRIHAKKTRLRKKRILQQMETTISGLEEEVMRLRKTQLDKPIGVGLGGDISNNFLPIVSPVLTMATLSYVRNS